MKKVVYKKNIVPGQCAAVYCTKKSKGRKLCFSCRSRKTRQEDPVKYAYTSLRNNAKRRQVLFTITPEEFREWCVKVRYIGFSGRSAESFTIDRIHNDIGYHIDNIQVLTRRNNIKKYFSYDYRSKTAKVTTDSNKASLEPDYF